MASKLVEAVCIGEYTEWHPPTLLKEYGAEGQPDEALEPWLKVARALLDKDQPRIDDAFEEARACYSPLGFRIVVGGFSEYASRQEDFGSVRLPPLQH